MGQNTPFPHFTLSPITKVKIMVMRSLSTFWNQKKKKNKLNEKKIVKSKNLGQWKFNKRGGGVE